MTPFDWSRYLETFGLSSAPERTRYEPQPDSPWSCPDCGAPVAIGVRAVGILDLRCPAHGIRYAVPPLGLSGELVERLPRPARMNPEERLWILSAACAEILEGSDPDRYIVVDATQHPCEFLILRQWPDGLAVEVSGREWDCPHCGNRPLPAANAEALQELGFVPGGRHRNPWRGDLPTDARGLAVLVERTLTVAYDLATDVEVVVYPHDTAACRRLIERLSRPSAL